MRVVVAAVPGAGKTTIIEMVKDKVKGVKVANMGDLIFQTAKKKLKIKNRDEMRGRLSIKDQRMFQEVASGKISRMRSKYLVVDTHTSIKTPNGYFPGLSEKTARAIKPDIIVFLDYNPQDIIKRRKEDKTRNRDEENEEDIEKDQKASIEFAYEAAAHVEAFVDIIDMREPEKKPFEHSKKAAAEIIKLLKNKER